MGFLTILSQFLGDHGHSRGTGRNIYCRWWLCTAVQWHYRSSDAAIVDTCRFKRELRPCPTLLDSR